MVDYLLCNTGFSSSRITLCLGGAGVPEGFSQCSSSTLNFQSSLFACSHHALVPSPEVLAYYVVLASLVLERGKEQLSVVLDQHPS